MKKNKAKCSTDSCHIEKEYPNIANWIHDGTIEIGFEYGGGIVARALDEGGTAWEGKRFKDLKPSLAAMDNGIEAWCKEMGI